MNKNGITSRIVVQAIKASALAATGIFAITACEPPPISSLAAEDGIARIRATHDDERWDLVISEVDEYRSRYPYTKHAAEAELLQADSFFQSGRYPEAIATYEAFTSKYPKHAQAGFALFRGAESLDKQSPEEIDREQIYSERAIQQYGAFLERFPNDEKVKEAKIRVGVLRKRIAEHHMFIARFYWKKDLYHSALSRYLKIIDSYPMYKELRDEAVEKASESYEELAAQLKEDPKSDKLRYFKNNSPESLLAMAKELRARKSLTSSQKEMIDNVEENTKEPEEASEVEDEVQLTEPVDGLPKDENTPSDSID